MARQIDKLNALAVARLAKPGRHSDGGGLYLVVDRSGAKRWAFLYRRRSDGKLSEMGLGGLNSVSLAKARELAGDARTLLASGQDPLVAKRSAKEVPTFGEFADELITSLEGGWRNEKHRTQWKTTLKTHAASLRGLAINQIETAHVLKVLTPLWLTKPETASRLRGRIERVLDAAKAKELRSGENPARWRGHLANLLSKRKKLTRGHHPAMPWGDVPTFIGRLSATPSITAYALEFVILTVARSGEVLRSVRNGEIMGAHWDEIDALKKVWTVPSGRMKGGRKHRVPLCDRAMAILKEMEPFRREDGFIFPGSRLGVPLSEMALEMVMRRLDAKPYTVHGFRSSFRDWAGDCTKFPREVAEAALAHVIEDESEQAYRRGDALEKRRKLMAAWASYCEPERTDNVTHLRDRRVSR